MDGPIVLTQQLARNRCERPKLISCGLAMILSHSKEREYIPLDVGGRTLLLPEVPWSQELCLFLPLAMMSAASKLQCPRRPWSPLSDRRAVHQILARYEAQLEASHSLAQVYDDDHGYSVSGTPKSQSMPWLDHL